MSEDAARVAAVKKFGNIARIKEDVRDVWVWAWWDACRQDARDAARRLRRVVSLDSIRPELHDAVRGTGRHALAPRALEGSLARGRCAFV